MGSLLAAESVYKRVFKECIHSGHPSPSPTTSLSTRSSPTPQAIIADSPRSRTDSKDYQKDSMFAGLSLKQTASQGDPPSSDSIEIPPGASLRSAAAIESMPTLDSSGSLPPSAFTFMQTTLLEFSGDPSESVTSTGRDASPESNVVGLSYQVSSVVDPHCNQKHLSDRIPPTAASLLPDSEDGPDSYMPMIDEASPSQSQLDGVPVSDEVLVSGTDDASVLISKRRTLIPWESEVAKTSAALSEKFVSHWTTMLALEQEDIDAADMCNSLLKAISESNGEIEVLRAAQIKAVDDEVYDQADELDTKIQEQQKLIDRTELKLKEASQHKSSIMGRRRKQIDLISSTSQLFESEMQTLKDSCQKDMDETTASTMGLLNDKEERMQQESSRMDRMLSIVNADLDRAHVETAEIHQMIDERTRDIQIEKEQATKQLKAVDAELGALFEKIRAKEKEQLELRSSLSGIDKRISEAGYAFDRQLSRIENQRSRIEYDKNDILTEQAELQALESKLSAQKQVLIDVQSNSSRLISSIDKIVEFRKHQLAMILEDAAFENGIEQKRRSLELAVESAQLRLAEQERKAHLLSTEKVRLEDDLQRHKDNIEDIGKKLPELGSAKVSAVSARDFKQASRISKEIKESLASRQDSLDILEKLKNDCGAVQKSIESHATPLQESQTAFELAQRDLDRVVLKRLGKRIATLTMSKEAVKGEELSLLDAQVRQLLESGRSLESRHGWSLSTANQTPSSSSTAPRTPSPTRSQSSSPTGSKLPSPTRPQLPSPPASRTPSPTRSQSSSSTRF